MSGFDGYQVDIRALSDAISQVSGEHDSMVSEIAALKATFATAASYWKSPSGSTFTGLTGNFNPIADKFMSVLEDAIGRMKTSLQNYIAAEETNTTNLKMH
jgi:hypothetical protein